MSQFPSGKRLYGLDATEGRKGADSGRGAAVMDSPSCGDLSGPVLFGAAAVGEGFPTPGRILDVRLRD
jgi:hypothetical protein